MDQAGFNSTFEPGELALLQRVFDDLRLERGILGGSVAANDLAAEMIQLYQRGMKDEQSLHRHFDETRFLG